MDLPYLIRRAANQYPNAVAVETVAGATSLSVLVARAERLANAFDSLGIPQGSAVGVLSENRAEYPEIDFGIALGRRIRVALNTRLNREDFRYALTNVSARALIHSSAFAEDAQSLASELGLIAICLDDGFEYKYSSIVEDSTDTPVIRHGSDEDPAWISFTSGTTGRPKGIVLSHRAIREVAFNLLIEIGPQSSGERIVLSQPLSHGAGYFVLPYLLSGGGVYVLERFDPDHAISLSKRPDIHTLKIVPAMFQSLFHAHDSSADSFGFERIVYGASPVAGPILDEALDRFGPKLVQIYGQSEAPATLTCLHEADHATPGPQRASAGRPWKTVAIEVRGADGEILPAGETGEITVRGPHMMSGYFGLEEETSKVVRDGRLWTKDMGVIDERGFVYLLGRQDEMINSGGFNISPREVEQAIQEHPGVAECIALGTPDERWGTAVGAVVALRPNRDVSVEELLSFSQNRLGFRSPKRLVVTALIPKNAYGKTDRQRLREIFDENGEDR